MREIEFEQWSDDIRKKLLLSLKLYGFGKTEQDIEPLTPATDGRKTLLTVMAIWESSRTARSGWWTRRPGDSRSDWACRPAGQRH